MLLLVDDTATSLYTKGRVLRQAGFEVAEARSGLEAITAVKALKPKLIILDIKLPDIDGYEVCKRIKSDPELASTMVLQMSARYVRPIDTAKALEAGADGCLTEPVEPVVLVATVRALLRLREALNGVSESNTTLRQIISSSPAAIIALDREGKVVTWNAAAEKIFGWSEAEVLGKPSPVQPIDSASSTEDVLSTRIEEHKTRRRTRQGTFADIILSSTPLHSANGDRSGVLIMCTDIAARKLAERQREESFAREREARKEAEAANRAKDEFLAVLSHELRSPLNAILSWASLLESGMLSPDKVSQAIGAIQRNSQVQAQLINDLLDISRIIAGKLRIDVKRANLSAIVEAALESVRPTAELKKIQINLDLPLVEPVFGDAARLQQIVRNLVSNAIKFTPERGTLDVQLLQTSTESEIIVKDNGVGIHPELLPHIFERFLQGDSTTSRAETGLGLGLAVARHLAELHGGSLSAESPGDGMGATFTLSLPMEEVALSAETSELKSAPPVKDELINEPLTGLDILVVDDEQDSREAFAMFLEQNGAKVTVASSVRNALAELERATPDVMLSDIGMAGEDGFDLIREVRARENNPHRRIQAVAVTGYVSSEDRRHALAEGYDAYLGKPLDLHELLRLLALVKQKKNASV